MTLCLTDNLPCHFTAGFAAGFCTTVVASPVDVVKTRFMNSTSGQYSGTLNCAFIMLKKEGPTAFYKGWAWGSGQWSLTLHSKQVGSWSSRVWTLFQVPSSPTFEVRAWVHPPTSELPRMQHQNFTYWKEYCNFWIRLPHDNVWTIEHCTKVLNARFNLHSLLLLSSSRFIPAFLRLGSWNIVMFVSYEQIKRIVTRTQHSWESPFWSHTKRGRCSVLAHYGTFPLVRSSHRSSHKLSCRAHCEAWFLWTG